MATKQLSYSDRLRHPLWQRCRLEVMQRDNFTCQHCRSTENTLNVHHKSYEKGRDPWDYPLINFVTLCERCHEKEHISDQVNQNPMPKLRVGIGFTSVDQFDEKISLMKNMEAQLLKLGSTADQLSIRITELESARASFLDDFPNGVRPPYIYD